MTERLQLYKCEICGNLVQVILSGVGELVCCGKNMILQNPKQEKTELGEKHIPVISDDKYKTRIVVNKHPMSKEHYIEFIEGITKDNSELYLKYLKPEEDPVFQLCKKVENIKALDYCNIHGLWGNTND